MLVSRPDQPPYEPIPDGMQAAILVSHFDLGIQADFVGERPKHKIALLWELAARRLDGKRFTICKELTATLGDLSTLRGFLESWRGQPLTEEELGGFELGYLHGTACTLDLQRKLKRNGGTFVDVVAVYRSRKGDPVLKVETPETFVPEWIARKMHEALPQDAVQNAGEEYVEEQPF